MVRKIFFYTVSVHHRPTSTSTSSSTLVFTPASSFVLLCTARGFISPRAASSSIVFDPNKTVEPPSCHLRHRFNQSTPDRLPFSSRPTITGLLTIYVIERHHLHFYTTVDHSPRLCAELCITINTNLQIYSICTLMGRVLCVLRILGDKVLQGAS